MGSSLAGLHSPAASPDLLAQLTAVFDRQPQALANPYPVYARLRAEAPVLRVGPLVVVSDYGLVQEILRDPVTFSSVRMLGSRVGARKAQLDDVRAEKLQELVEHEAMW